MYSFVINDLLDIEGYICTCKMLKKLNVCNMLKIE